jgi:hypothetical protein
MDHRGLLIIGESMGARGEKKSSAAATRALTAATARSAVSATRRVPAASIILDGWFLGPFRSLALEDPLFCSASGHYFFRVRAVAFKVGAVAAVGWQAARSFYGEAASRD